MFGRNRDRIMRAAGLTEALANRHRQPVAQELSQMQRIGEISVTTDAVERTMNGEFDSIIKNSMSVTDAASAIADMVGRR